MLTADFELAKHPEFGELGLKMVGRSWADPFSGMAVAHDLLEHGQNDDGTTEHELMALGASLYVRDGESYYHAKGQWRADPADNIASDMTEQARYLDGRTLRDPGRTRPCAADNFVCRAWTAAVRLLRAECDPEDFPPFLRPGERAKFIGWMRRGYRMAARRYSGVAEWRMCDLFQQIERAADEAIKHHDYEGQRFRFSVNVKRQTVQVRELYPEDDFS